MDRHVKWLRRRIAASVATQTAETFGIVTVAAFALMQWRTGQSAVSSLFASVVIGQLVALARLGHAMRNNPLNNMYMRRYIDEPFNYRVARFQEEEAAHAVAQQLPGFAPVATVRDLDVDPSPVFDVYHDPSRVVAASVSRASGSVALISSLVDGRILVTDARAMPPHQRLVMNLAADDSISGVISAHQHAVSHRSDVVQLATSAHQVVLDSLAIEYESYVQLGPMLSPFLDLEAGGSWARLSARIKPAELVELPTRLGPDLPLPEARAVARVEGQSPTPIQPAGLAVATASPAVPPVHAPAFTSAALESAARDVVEAQVARVSVTVPEIAAPNVTEAGVTAAEVVTAAPAPPAVAVAAPPAVVVSDPITAEVPVVVAGAPAPPAPAPAAPAPPAVAVAASPAVVAEAPAPPPPAPPAASVVPMVVAAEVVSAVVAAPLVPHPAALPIPAADSATSHHAGAPETISAPETAALTAPAPSASDLPIADLPASGPAASDASVVYVALDGLSSTPHSPQDFVPRSAHGAVPDYPPAFLEETPAPVLTFEELTLGRRSSEPSVGQPVTDAPTTAEVPATAMFVDEPSIAELFVDEPAAVAELFVDEPLIADLFVDGPLPVGEAFIEEPSGVDLFVSEPAAAVSLGDDPAITQPMSALPVAVAPVAAVPVGPAPVAPAPVAVAPVGPAPVAVAPVAPAPVAPAPVAVAPVAAVPVAAAPVFAEPPTSSPASDASHMTEQALVFSGAPSDAVAHSGERQDLHAQAPQLAAALAYDDGALANRPRLSAAMRAQSPAPKGRGKGRKN